MTRPLRAAYGHLACPAPRGRNHSCPITASTAVARVPDRPRASTTVHLTDGGAHGPPRIAAAEAAGTDLLLDVRDIELYAHVSRKTVYRLVSRGVLREKRIGRNIRISKRVLDSVLSQGIEG